MNSRTAEVLFSADVGRPEVRSRRDSLALWTARLEGDRWSRVRFVGRLGRRSVDHRQIAGDAVIFRDQMVAAILELAHETSKSRIALARIASARSVVEFPLPTLDGATYVDIAVVRDTLWLAAVLPSAPVPGIPDEYREAGLWVSYQVGAEWAAPRRVAVGDARSTREPRLVGDVGEVAVAWIQAVDGRDLMRWRGVAGESSQISGERAIRSFIVRGGESFGGLLSVASDDSTAVILRVTSTGLQELATVTTVAGIPALLIGPPSYPIAITPVAPALAEGAPFGLAAYDLRCLIAATK